MDNNSPFHQRSGLTRRSPVNSPTRQLSSPAFQPNLPPPLPPKRDENPPEVVSTQEIQNWMISIEKCLKEVCTLVTDGKMNSEQKLRISNLCRTVSHSSSQMAVQYQSLKQKAIQAHITLQELKENRDLSHQLQAIKQSIEESSKPVSGSVSFAQMLKKGTGSFIQPSNVSSVTIYPTDKSKSSEETKSLVQKIIRPEQMKLHVRGLRKVNNGGIIISTDSKDDIEKLKKSEQLTTSGLTVDDTYKRRPRIVVIGVPTSLQELEVYKCIFQQNLADKIENLTLDSFLASIKLSHKSGKKDAESCNYVIEVSALIRKALITKDRVFVNWSSCPVRDFTLVTRCFKCQQYGHAAKSCREETNTCGHCGEVGHTFKDCTKKAEQPKCATCLRFKKPCDHKTGDALCPAKNLAEKRQCGGFDNGPMQVRRAGAKSSPDLSPGTSVARQLTWRVTSTRQQRNKIGMSVSHPQLSYMNGCGTGTGSGGNKRGRDVATQTPPSIAAETRRARLRPLKITLPAPNALTLRFLANRKKGRSMSANAVANEQKATKVLGLVFFTFVLCWAPFFLLNILFAACPSCIVPEHVVDICLWLGYMSSTINPIIYTVFNRTFRAAFLRLLRCHCSRRGGCTRYRSVGSTRGASQLCARSALPLAISLRPTNMNPAAAEQTDTVIMETAMGDYNLRY